jgi:hypothetical protein
MKQERTRINLFIITGLTSAGKDTLVQNVLLDHNLSKDIYVLSKYTTRDLRASERVADSETLYAVKSVSCDELSHHPGYFGIFKRNNNLYGFSTNELIEAFGNNYRTALCIYSGCDRLVHLREEVNNLQLGIKTPMTTSMVTLKIEQFHILVDTPKNICLKRLTGRGLREAEVKIKRSRLDDDQTILDSLRNEGFFNLVVPCSDRDELIESTKICAKFISKYNNK